MNTLVLKYQIFIIVCLLSSKVGYANYGGFSNLSSNNDYSLIHTNHTNFFTINRVFLVRTDVISLFSGGPYQVSQTAMFMVLVLFSFLFIFLLAFFRSYKQKLSYIDHLEAENISIEHQKKTMERHQNYKEKFITILAHDVINPFNSLIGFSTLLQEDFNVISEIEKKEYIDVICRSAKSNYQTIKKLFNWVRKSQKTNLVSVQGMNLSSIIETVLQSHLSMFKSKNIIVKNSISESLNLNADGNILSLIISNFVNNAIKFTPNSGHIEIGCAVKEKVFQVFVKDNGLGMTDTQLEHLFDSENKNRSTQGTHKECGFGLGLILCRELAELHHGRIMVSSCYNKGTTATLELPK